MIVKQYRYRVQPDKVDQFLDIQRRADKIYRKHLSYRVTHVQSRSDRADWVETHWYQDMRSCELAEKLTEKEPELNTLFAEFTELLDPAAPTITQELFDNRSILAPV